MTKTTQALLTALAATVIYAGSIAALRADERIHNFYISADAGAIFQQNADFSERGSPNITAGFNTGARVDLALGYNVNENLALEIEPGFMWNSVDTLGGFSLAGNGRSIDLESVPLLVSLIYRVPTGTAFTPYVGAGIGADITFFDGQLP